MNTVMKHVQYLFFPLKKQLVIYFPFQTVPCVPNQLARTTPELPVYKKNPNSKHRTWHIDLCAQFVFQ